MARFLKRPSQEVARAVVLPVGLARDELVEGLHEPGEVGEAFAPFADLARMARLGLGRNRFPAPFREDRAPAADDLERLPALGPVGAGAEDEMEMVGHGGVGDEVYGEEGRKEGEALLDPAAAVVEVLACGAVAAAAGEAVVDLDLVVVYGFAAGEHGAPRGASSVYLHLNTYNATSCQ